MHLVGFIIRIYHDARSPERQIHGRVLCTQYFLARVRVRNWNLDCCPKLECGVVHYDVTSCYILLSALLAMHWFWSAFRS